MTRKMSQLYLMVTPELVRAGSPCLWPDLYLFLMFTWAGDLWCRSSKVEDFISSGVQEFRRSGDQPSWDLEYIIMIFSSTNITTTKSACLPPWEHCSIVHLVGSHQLGGIHCNTGCLHFIHLKCVVCSVQCAVLNVQFAMCSLQGTVGPFKQACCAGCRRRPFPMQLHQ